MSDHEQSNAAAADQEMSQFPGDCAPPSSLHSASSSGKEAKQSIMLQHLPLPGAAAAADRKADSADDNFPIAFSAAAAAPAAAQSSAADTAVYATSTLLKQELPAEQVSQLSAAACSDHANLGPSTIFALTSPLCRVRGFANCCPNTTQAKPNLSSPICR